MKKGLLLIISGAVLLALNGEQSVQAATTSKKTSNVNVLVAFNPRNR
ncbi:hypothetical protein [Lentilactobacillus senioris]